MMIFKKAIPRRTFLRGAGATLALPLLDAMVPAFGAPAETTPPVRLGVVYHPNGVWPVDRWTPKGEGTGFEISPTLEPLAPFRDQLLVLTGLDQKEAFSQPNNPGGGHEAAFSQFLAGVRPKVTNDNNVPADDVVSSGGHYPPPSISIDQIAAQKIGKETQLASLELALFSGDLIGCASYCSYLSTISWRSATTPNPMESNPRAVFERLFGDSDSTDRATRLARLNEQKSILDWLLQDAAGFAKEIGPSDRAKLTEYLDSVRDVERRIQISEQQARNHEVPKLDKPAGAPSDYEQYAKLMIDLQVLAYQSDVTRVITFSLGREGSVAGRGYPEIGITDLHHTLTHLDGDPIAQQKLGRIDHYLVTMFAYFVGKLRSTPDGDGSLLDHSILLYGSGMGNGASHRHDNLPLLLVGGGAGIKAGRHNRYPTGTPVANLYLTLLDKLGVSLDNLGDSTGKLDLLSM